MKKCNFFSPKKKKEIEDTFKVKTYKQIIEDKIKITKNYTLEGPVLETYNRYKETFKYKKMIPNLSNIKQVSLKDIFKKIELNIDGDVYNCYKISKGDSLYKGMRYFYTKKLEEEYFDKNKDSQFWFAKEDIAMMYAQQYFGGISAYKIKKDIILINMNDKNNLKILSKKFKDSKYSKALCTKFGINCDIIQQIKNILKFNNWGNEIWLRDDYFVENNEKCNKGSNFFGAGRLDRIITKLLSVVYKDNLDGWLIEDFESPFFSATMLGEICFFNSNNIERDTTNIYDWYQWRNYLPFKIPQQNRFIFNQRLSQNNTNFRLILFYLNHDKNYTVPNNIKNVFLTFNTHYLESINELYTEEECYKNLLKKLIYKLSPLIICLQEFPKKYINRLQKDTTNKGYKLISANNGSKNDSLKLCLLVKRYIFRGSRIIKKFINGKNRDFISTQIELNDSIYNIIGCHFPNDVGYKDLGKYKDKLKFDLLYKKNSNTRINYLKNILRSQPNILMGDFNFDKIDNETDLINNSNFKNSFSKIINCVNNTTPDTLVDYILYNRDYFNNYKYKTLNYVYSDHLPLIMYE